MVRQTNRMFITKSFLARFNGIKLLINSERTLLGVLPQNPNLAEALYYQVHSHDIMHLDTQTKNIICDTNRRLSFIDYGMSERVNARLYANRTDFNDGVNDFQALAANLYEIWTGNFASQIWPIGDDNEGEDIILDPINGLDDKDYRSLADLISGLQHAQITSIATVISESPAGQAYKPVLWGN